MRQNFALDSGWYGNFVEDERALDNRNPVDPTSAVGEGWLTYPHHPRFGSNYRGLSSRLDLLLECYSYLTFEERVRTTYAWLTETLRAVGRRAEQVRELVLSSRTPPRHIAVSYRIEAMAEPVEVLTRQPRTRQGAPHVVRIPFLARFVGTAVVERPRAYALPAQLAPFLHGHGLRTEEAPKTALCEVGRLEGTSHIGGRAILEAAGVRQHHVSWQKESRRLPGGTILLPTEQPLGALAVYLCEPQSDDGLLENGFLPTPEQGEEFPILRVLE